MFGSDKKPIKFCLSNLFGGHGTPCPYGVSCHVRFSLELTLIPKVSDKSIVSKAPSHAKHLPVLQSCVSPER